MKYVLVLMALTFGFSLSFAQETPWCGTDQYNEAIFDANPTLRTQMHEHLVRVTSGIYAGGDREDEFIIPVVVHIMHNNGDGNISYEQVQSGIDMLNEDFNRENADAGDTRNTDEAPFAPIASNMGIRFELAKLDPDGNCTNGIERRNVGERSYNTGNRAKHTSQDGLDAWNRNYYFNIWIVNSIDSGGEGTILGYAEFPYGGGSSNYGVIIRNDSYGTLGTATGDRTLSHEVGHCLGLLHTFQGSCHGSACDSNGDYCCDTPPVSEAQWSCGVLQNTCDDIPSGDFYDFDALDQFENFMSYSPCQNMFSTDQKNIVLGNFESIPFLGNLVDPDHNAEAGVGLPDVLCKAQFLSDYPVICAGNDLQFYDDSYGNVTERTWTFEGGTPSTSTEENPVITYNAPGLYHVELEATDGVSTVSTLVEDYILVLPNPGTGLPYSENFETIATVPDFDRFLVLNDDEDVTWELSETVGYSGTHCVYIDNRGNNSRTKDVLISGSIDLSDVSLGDNMVFNFKYAYRKRRSDDDEWLRFYISKDCGKTWALRKNIHGDGLSELTQSGSAYVPAGPDEWTQVNITSINSTYYTSDFRFKFEFQNDDGNNIYLDDINLYPVSMTGITESEITALRVYPNPATDRITVQLSTTSNEDVTVTLLNAIGEEIEVLFSGATQSSVSNEINYNTIHLPAGVYFVRAISNSGNSEIIRFVKN